MTLPFAATAALVVAVLLARTLTPHGPNTKALPNGAVQGLHMRLRQVLPAPAELWGVRVPAPTSVVGPHEAALLSSFLRARKWDVDDTLFMFTAALKWRSEFGVAALRAHHFRDLPQDVFRGRTRTGKLVAVLRLGDLKGEAFDDVKRFLRWRVFMQEGLNHLLDFGTGVQPSYMLVLDCDGFSGAHFGRAARRCATELSRVFQDFYPDFLDQIVICNPPAIFAFAFGALRPFLPRNFVNLIRVHHGDQASALAKEGVRSSDGVRRGKWFGLGVG